MTKINPEIFERAAERIERTGMTKGDYYKGHDEGDFPEEYPLEVGEHIRETDVKCCALGAIAAEVATADTEEGVVSEYSNFFAKTLGLTSWDIPEWNDAPSRRKRDLVRAFRRAARVARKEE